jgi:hypothetical protein
MDKSKAVDDSDLLWSLDLPFSFLPSRLSVPNVRVTIIFLDCLLLCTFQYGAGLSVSLIYDIVHHHRTQNSHQPDDDVVEMVNGEEENSK